MASRLGPEDHYLNPALLSMAKTNVLGGFSKSAFVPGGDPSMGGGADPSQGGGAPPMDPSQGGGAPPDAGGGAPAAPPGDPRIDQLIQMVTQMQQNGQMGGPGGGAAGAGGKNALTPKIDEKAVLLQILKIQARMADAMGIQIPASEMVVNQTDLQGLAQATSQGGPMPGMDPTAGAGGGAAGGQGAIGGVPPMQPMQGAGQPGATKTGAEKAAAAQGAPFDGRGLTDMGNRARAIMAMRNNKAA